MGTPNFQNRTLFKHDNLDVLRGINSESVHLIATDPPFKKSKDFKTTPDSLVRGAKFHNRWHWIEDVREDWLRSILNEYPEVWQIITATRYIYGSDMAAFLAFISIRLVEMRRILREDGSIYLHCDSAAHAYLKLLMDAIFGKRNLRNEIIWAYTEPSNAAHSFQRKHDAILFYAKSDAAKFNHDAARIPRKRGSGSQLQLMERDDSSNDEITEIEAACAKRGKVISDYWTDIAGDGNIPINECAGYPTQKPLALYERIIKASSNPSDIVLDPFCGAATTLIAAERLSRKWVGIDHWDDAHKTLLDRLQKEQLIVPDAERFTQPNLLTFGDVHHITEPPKRNDHEDPMPSFPNPAIQIPKSYPPPRLQKEKLLLDLGAYCQGCGHDYGFDTRVLEVDHIKPKSAGGTDAYDNLTLLCPPCNRIKSDRYTIHQLQEINAASGRLTQENKNNINSSRLRTRNRTRAKRNS